MKLLDSLRGYKTYLSAAGLVGLGVFQFTQGDIPGGIQSILGAAAAASVRHAVAGTAADVVVPKSPPYGPQGMTGHSSM